MSEKAEANGQDAMVQPFWQLWSGYAEQSQKQTQAMMDAWAQSANPQELRKKWFEALSTSFDAFLRSPWFLESLQRNSEIVNTLKEQANKTLDEKMQSAGLPHANDIRLVLDTVRNFEMRVMDRLSSLEERLRTLEQREISVS